MIIEQQGPLDFFKESIQRYRNEQLDLNGVISEHIPEEVLEQIGQKTIDLTGQWYQNANREN